MSCKSDCKYVVDGSEAFVGLINSNKAVDDHTFPLLGRGNADLWQQSVVACSQAGRTKPATKIKAHMDVREVIEGRADSTDCVGNHVADALAGAAASMAAEDETTRRTAFSALGFCVAVRVAIAGAEANRCYHDKKVWEEIVPANP